MNQTAAVSSPYADVYVALKAIEPSARAVPLGTESTIGRTLDYLRASRDTDALRRLESIAILVEALWHCARSGDRAARACAHAELARLTHDWLAAAPMFPPAIPDEGGRLH